MFYIKFYLFVSFIFIYTFGFSQNNANIWYFGDHAGLDFNSGQPIPLTNSNMWQPEGVACISDTQGDLLFYTNGMTIWNKNHEEMDNGTGLMGGSSSTQSGIIVPQPGNNLIYFVFTVPQEIGADGLRYSIVDLSLNGGLGAVTSKNIFLVQPTEEKVTAVKHANNIDVWVITHTWNSDAFYCFLVTSEGVNTTPVVSNTGSYHSGIQGETHSYLRASPCGGNVAIVVRPIDSFEIFDFDNSTGIISNPLTFPPDFSNPYGIEFSPDESRIYLSSYGGSSIIVQYDLLAGTPEEIFNSKIVIGAVPTSHIGALQLGPDKKIYSSYNNYTSGHDYLGIIHNPNGLGMACNFESDALYLEGGEAIFGLPNFIQSYFCITQDFNYIYTCHGDTTNFTITNSVDLLSVAWDFDDPASGSANYSNEFNPTHVFSSPGIYSVMLVSNFTTTTDTLIKEITINPSPDIFLGNDTTYCINENIILDPGQGFTEYLWQDSSTNSTYMADTSGIYWVEVINEFGCSDADTIQINLYPSPEIDIGNDTLLCLGDSLIINAGSGYSSYLWSNGSIDSSIVVNTLGLYFVEVTNEFGCSAMDSILIQIYPVAIEELNLGSDTTFCPGEDFILNAGSGYTFYQWQNGSNDSIFIADTAGVYYVYVENPCGWGSDTIVLDVFPITNIDLGSDTAICYGESVLLDPGFGFQSYLWQDGSSNQFYYTSQSGSYWVQVIDDNSCLAYDTINLEFIIPDPSIGNDTAVCSGDSMTFFANPIFENYLWNDGSTLSSLTADSTGFIWCEVIDTMGCVGRDSVFLDIIFPPQVSLGNDTVFCVGDSLLLFALPQGNNYDITWQDGSQDSVFMATQQGNYWVLATNQCGSDADSVFVNVQQLPDVYLGSDTILALNDYLILDAGEGFEDYLWSDGSSFQKFTVHEPGSYWVNVFDGVCYNADTINIEPIDCDILIPVVITPNGDKYNDDFYAKTSEDIYEFSLMVFNRWGEKIWKTENKEDKWDGTRNGKPVAEGTYYWITEFKCKGSPEGFDKIGSVTVLR